jgi:hypothetical protein
MTHFDADGAGAIHTIRSAAIRGMQLPIKLNGSFKIFP